MLYRVPILHRGSLGEAPMFRGRDPSGRESQSYPPLQQRYKPHLEIEQKWPKGVSMVATLIVLNIMMHHHGLW